MAYVNRPYGGSYYEADRPVLCDAPYGGAYDAQYTVDEYGNRVYQRRNALGNVVTEVVSEVVPGGHHHHPPHHPVVRPTEYIHRPTEYIDRPTEYSACDPYRRIY